MLFILLLSWHMSPYELVNVLVIAESSPSTSPLSIVVGDVGWNAVIVATGEVGIDFPRGDVGDVGVEPRSRSPSSEPIRLGADAARI
jgi:hypothetical protein